MTFSVDFIAWLKEGGAFDMYLVFSGEIIFHLCGIADRQCACLGCWQLPFQCGRPVVCQLWTYFVLIWRESLWSTFVYSSSRRRHYIWVTLFLFMYLPKSFNRTWGPIPWPQFWRPDIWFVFWGFVQYYVNKSQKPLFLYKLQWQHSHADSNNVYVKLKYHLAFIV